jgi:endonuclease/exonuclease/phosphatase (EEP) superfamily protein YafD
MLPAKSRCFLRKAPVFFGLQFLDTIREQTMGTGKYLLYVFGYLFMIFSLIPLIRSDNWMFRVFEYPRSQKLIITTCLFLASLFTLDFAKPHDIVFVILLLLNIAYLFYQIWPYTFFSRKQMKRTSARQRNREFKLLICNVYQDNRDVQSCLRMIAEHAPELVLLVEIDAWWKKELDTGLKTRYAHCLAKPLENTYGIVLYSKFELIDPQIKFLVEEDIPSIHTKVKLPSGQVFQLFGLHPKPPVPHETARSTERDGEILLVGKTAKKLTIPVIVAGDLNDVAWSYTTELFLKVSRLIDPRRGRGFFNTFHAKYWFFRWPLDHVFCSEHFQLVELKRLPSVGSDHFPMLAYLQLAEEKKAENEKEILKADPEEERAAQKKIRKAM